MLNYVIATDKSWHMNAFAAARPSLPGAWTLCLNKADLTNAVVALAPRYVFFPHWSHVVTEDILEATECVCFHMADVPYGRGGSPLQNLIVRGHDETKLTALRMVRELDAGPVYSKRPMSLAGSAQEIFERTADLAIDMIRQIVTETPEPVPQEGEPTVFIRRNPTQSLLPETADTQDLFDHIRMLDAPGYPHAFLEHGPWRLTFQDALLDSPDRLSATVIFTRKDDDQ